MSSRLGTSGSSNSTKRNIEHAKSGKKNSAPFDTAAPEKQKVTTAETRKASPAVTTRLAAGERQRMIEEAAFYRAEKRGFDCGGEVNDWLEAEAEINARYPE